MSMDPPRGQAPLCAPLPREINSWHLWTPNTYHFGPAHRVEVELPDTCGAPRPEVRTLLERWGLVGTRSTPWRRGEAASVDETIASDAPDAAAHVLGALASFLVARCTRAPSRYVVHPGLRRNRHYLVFEAPLPSVGRLAFLEAQRVIRRVRDGDTVHLADCLATARCWLTRAERLACRFVRKAHRQAIPVMPRVLPEVWHVGEGLAGYVTRSSASWGGSDRARALRLTAENPLRIPVIAITGSSGKTTTARMVAHVLRDLGCRVAQTDNGGVLLDGRPLYNGGGVGVVGVWAALSHPDAQVAVLEVTQNGLWAGGLGYQSSHVTAVLNIGAAHVGSPSAPTAEDLYQNKKFIAEQTRPGGAVVLNAQSPSCLRLADELTDRRIVLFGVRPGQSEPDRDLSERGQLLGARDDAIVWWDSAARAWKPFLPFAAVPACVDGCAQFNLSNAMAACAVVLSLPLPVINATRVAQALRTFEPRWSTNPGRFNLYERQGRLLILDRAHDIDHFRAVLAACRNLMAKRSSGRLLVLCNFNGEYSADSMREVGDEVLEHADWAVFADPPRAFRRGWQRLEIPRAMAGLESSPTPSGGRCELAPDEVAGAKRLLAESRPGDTVLVCAHEIAAINELFESAFA